MNDADLNACLVAVFRAKLSGDYRRALELIESVDDEDDLLSYARAVCQIKLGLRVDAINTSIKLFDRGKSLQMKFFGSLFLFELQELKAAKRCLDDLLDNPATSTQLREEIGIVLNSIESGGWQDEQNASSH